MIELLDVLMMSYILVGIGWFLFCVFWVESYDRKSLKVAFSTLFLWPKHVKYVVKSIRKEKLMRHLFNEKYRTYNNDGRELSHKTERALKDTMSDINKKDLNIYEAENIMISTVGIMFCELRLTYSRDTKNKEKL